MISGFRSFLIPNFNQQVMDALNIACHIIH